ncbi:peptidase inhibitor family I36 protein [Streptomyces sp. TBY4]|uniref:peptidase inhibitor family I36 protein n=1 Tax=Streptomyces sp. TBY4 TaxID=2962030 RepID=UPI0020B810D7|nr:peptidase inhibitor family I36 protein [Streptomyces sp. TBY4]MCP3756510.1 peptidase inhibitor family I36 protein [Streptomyces sp. TBY4]
MTDSRPVKINILRGSWIVGALALLCSALFALPASADAYPDCATDRLCLYTGQKGSMAAGETKPRAYEHQNPQSYSGEFSDKTKSVFNNTGYWACLYGETGWGSAVAAVKPGGTADISAQSSVEELKNMAAVGVSSHKLAPSRGLCFTGYERCPDNQLCLFKETAGRGAWIAFTASTDAYATEWDRAAMSVMNRTTKHACLYSNIGQTGSWNSVTNGVHKAYAVLSGDSTSLVQPYLGDVQSHKLASNSDCTS